MAPVLYTYNHVSVAVKVIDLLHISELLHYYFDGFLYYSFLPTLGVTFLHYFPRTALNFIYTVVGADRVYHVDPAFMPMMARNDVGGTSTKDVVHWIQNTRSGNMAQFDYGEDGNMV
jgi:hypothetical protein